MDDAISADADSVQVAVRRLTMADDCLPRHSPTFEGPGHFDATALINAALSDIETRLEGLVTAMRHESSAGIDNIQATVRDLFTVDERASDELGRLHNVFGDSPTERIAR